MHNFKLKYYKLSCIQDKLAKYRTCHVFTGHLKKIQDKTLKSKVCTVNTVRLATLTVLCFRVYSILQQLVSTIGQMRIKAPQFDTMFLMTFTFNQRLISLKFLYCISKKCDLRILLYGYKLVLQLWRGTEPVGYPRESKLVFDGLVMPKYFKVNY